MIPWSTLVQGPDGDFYGTASFGGQYGAGSVFKITPQGMLTTLHSFSVEGGGASPQAGLTLGADGNFYGTTRDHTPSSPGTIFRITTNGVYTLLFSFDRTNGESPWNGPLTQASDGFLYGMTPLGGNLSTIFGYGTVFRISRSGTFASLYSFDGRDGSAPYGGLVEGSDGEFYGMTSQGGQGSFGSVFKITSQGSLTPLLSFGGANGAVPFSALLKGADGNFYGTTIQGGGSYGNTNSINGEGFGTIFKMTPGGALTTLFSFQGTNGEYPYATLVQGSDGDFYGTTLSGGAFTNELFPGFPEYIGYGTVFRFSTNGTLTTLASFAGTNGAEIIASLTPDGPGNFYGTTQRGGAHDMGTVFRLSVSSPLTINCSGPATAQCGEPVNLTATVNGSIEAASAILWSVNGELVQTNIIQWGGSTSVSFVFPKGTNLVTASVAGTTAFCSSTITVIDSEPPAILRVTASPNVLWPPNHQMVTVAISAAVADDCSSTSWKIIAVRSNESIDSPGAPKTSPDWEILDDHTVSLRTERSANGAGRVYAIEIQARDESGNLSETKVITVRVPKTPGR